MPLENLFDRGLPRNAADVLYEYRVVADNDMVGVETFDGQVARRTMPGR